MGNMRELTIEPEEIQMIDVERTSMVPFRRKMVDHRRKRRNIAIRRWATVAGVSLALNIFQVVVIYVLQAGPI